MYRSRIVLSVGGSVRYMVSFGKFQYTERFLIHCARHFSSRLPTSGGTCKYATAPSTKKTLRDSLPIDMLLSAVSVLVVAQSSLEVPEGLMNNPVFKSCATSFLHLSRGLPLSLVPCNVAVANCFGIPWFCILQA